MSPRPFSLRPTLYAALALAAVTSAGAAQAPDTATPPPAVGQMAPDFSLPGATRYGRLTSPVKLSDFRGETVVIAFFIRARTRG